MYRIILSILISVITLFAYSWTPVTSSFSQPGMETEFSINRVTSNTKYYKPNEVVDFTVSFYSMEFSRHELLQDTLFVWGALSRDTVWSDDDRMFIYDGSGNTPLSNLDKSKKGMQIIPTDGVFRKSFTTTIPSDFVSGEKWFVLVQAVALGHFLINPKTSDNGPGVPRLEQLDSTHYMYDYKYRSYRKIYKIMHRYDDIAAPLIDVQETKDVVFNRAHYNGHIADAEYDIYPKLPFTTIEAWSDDESQQYKENDTIKYYQTDFNVTLKTASGGSISYNLGKNSGSFSTDKGKVSLKGTPDTVTLSGTGVLKDHLDGKGSWVFVRILPPMKILADTSDTNNSFTSGDTIIYTTEDLKVNLTTESGGTIDYSIGNDNGNFTEKGVVSLSGKLDTVTLKATSKGADKNNGHGEWVFIRKLPKAILNADTSSVANSFSSGDTIVYKTLDLSVNITTDKGGKVVYSIGSDTVTITDSGVLSLAKYGDTITVKATTINSSTISISKTWIFIRKLPPAIIVATPSVATPSSQEFSTASLDIALSVLIKGVKYMVSDSVSIWYTLKNQTPDTTKSYTKKLSVGESVVITGNDTLQAVAFFSFAELPPKAIWYYKQVFADAILEATPGSSSATTPYEYNKSSLKITLKTGSNDTIHYSIKSLGGSSTSFNSIIVGSGEVTITGDDTIWGYASGLTANRVDTVWTYKSNLPASTLTATPSDIPVLYFGHNLDITLESNSDTIRYTKDGIVPTKSSTIYNKNVDTIKFTDSDNDTIILKGYAYGSNFKGIKKDWTYIRDTLPEVKIGAISKKFTKTLSISLSVDSVATDWKNFKIYYTTDGSDPTTSSMVYSGSFTIDTTSIIKAIAFADNRIESKISTDNYTLVAQTKEAWYYDRSGDGAIDEAIITLTKSVNSLPSELILISPYNSKEVVTVSKENMVLEDNGNKIRVTLSTPFAFLDNTKFEKKQFGTINGKEYDSDLAVVIDDSVAPVILKASTCPGKIINTDIPITRAEDTIKVQFSEEVTIGDMFEPFKFIRGTKEYSIKMDKDKSTISGDFGRFVIDEVIGVKEPVTGDSIYINPLANISGGGIAQVNDKNRRVILDVNDLPYLLLINALSPVNPLTSQIPLELNPNIYKSETALIIIADFLTKVKNADKIMAEMSILDATGNLVNRSSAIGSGESLVSELLDTDRTRIVFYWNGQNMNGRNVGAGSYLVLVRIVDAKGVVVEKQIMVGVLTEK